MRTRLQLILLILTLPLFTKVSWAQNSINNSDLDLYTFDLDEAARNHLLRANEQFELLQFTEALAALDRAVFEHPTSPIVLLQRARLRQMLGMDGEAAADYNLAKKYNPYAADIFGYNGDEAIINVLYSAPQNSLVGLSLDKRLNYYYDYIDNNYIEGKLDLDELRLLTNTIQLKESGDFEGATLSIDSLLTQYPNSAIGYDLKGTIELNQDRQAEAYNHFVKASELDDKFAISWYNLSRIERENGQSDQAIEHLQKAIDLQENLTKAYFDKALLKKLQDKDKEAITYYNKIINMRGEGYFEAYLNRGLTRKMLGDYDGAISDINRVIEVYKDTPDLYVNRGNLYLLFGEDQNAIKDYNKAIRLDKFNFGAYHNRALAYLRMNRTEDACADLEEAIALGHTLSAKILQHFCR